MKMKMCRETPICKICKAIGQAIDVYEARIPHVQKQHDNPSSKSSRIRKMAQESLKRDIERYKFHLQGLKNSYKEILGVEYGSTQTYDTPKEGMNEFLACTLYRRGITNVTYENIEPRNGEEYVRLHWVEKIE